jgi:hypothetical protein
VGPGAVCGAAEPVKTPCELAKRGPKRAEPESRSRRTERPARGSRTNVPDGRGRARAEALPAARDPTRHVVATVEASGFCGVSACVVLVPEFRECMEVPAMQGQSRVWRMVWGSADHRFDGILGSKYIDTSRASTRWGYDMGDCEEMN